MTFGSILSIRHSGWFLLVMRSKSLKFLLVSQNGIRSEAICDFLKAFEELTLNVSAHRKPTAHKFLPVVLCIRHALKDPGWQTTDVLKEMASVMLPKLDKYWDPEEKENDNIDPNRRRKSKDIELNIALFIATFLDPRRKEDYLDFFYNKVSSNDDLISKQVDIALDWVKKYVKEYELLAATSTTSSTPPSQGNTTIGSPIAGKRKLEEEFAQHKSCRRSHVRKSELDTYLEESCEEDTPDFDVCAWWKRRAEKFPILSSMARDFLAIPLSTVASESAPDLTSLPPPSYLLLRDSDRRQQRREKSDERLPLPIQTPNQMLASATAPSSSSPSYASTRPRRTASARGRRLRPVLAMAASDDPRAAPTRSVAVVGAGVSGLVAAYRLRKSGVRVTVFEADDRAGGKIRTNSDSGFLWDEGANTMTESALEASSLIDDLGLEDRLQYPNSQHKRYTVKDGAPALIPSDPIALMKSSLLSTKSKFKLFLEPFLYEKSSTKNSKKVSDEHIRESVGSFFERHFGKEVVDYLIDPFVAGTSAGDPESLSIRHAFPGLWNLEKKYGSIIVGAILSKLTAKGDSTMKGSAISGKGRNKRVSFSFHGGMQTLVDALHKEVGDSNVKLGTQVLSLACHCDGLSASDGWSIFVDSKDASYKELAKNQPFDAVIMTAPLSNVQRMKFTKSGAPFVLDFLPKVDYLPLSLMVTAFKKEDVKRPLEGFGVLVPYKEQQKHGLKTLGTLFSSMMFPDRAPSDQHLFTTFVGGSHNRDLAGAPTVMLKQLVTSDLRKLLGVEGQPTFVKHIHWRNAFPLYGHDYDSALEAIGKMESDLPGFFYAGNNKDGLAVGNVIASGSKTADLVISYLESGIKQAY